MFAGQYEEAVRDFNKTLELNPDLPDVHQILSVPGTAFFGGNSVSSANANFIPLISQDLDSLLRSASAVKPPALFNAQVIAASLNVRSEPDPSSPILATLDRGTNVQVFEVRNGWDRIDEVESHWVKGSFLNKKEQ